MTTREAMELIRAAVLGDGSAPVGATWADLGAGSGTFSFALARLLGADGSVVAVDREEAALESLRSAMATDRGTDPLVSSGAGPDAGERGVIEPVAGDFRDPSAIAALRDTRLDGALFANALHFDVSPGTTLRRFADRLAPDGRLVVVEYQDRPPNPWVPHPLPVARLERVAEAQGLTPPRVVGERPSSYGGYLYCAWLARA